MIEQSDITAGLAPNSIRPDKHLDIHVQKNL